MKKLYYLICIACALTTLSLNVRAAETVHIRFWDNGILLEDVEVTAGSGKEHAPADYYSGTPSSCDGYTFVGWRQDSVLVNEKIYPSDALAGKLSLVDVQYDDIDLYALYEKDVTCYTRADSWSNQPAGAYLIIGKNGTDYYAMGNTNLSTPTESSPLAGVNAFSISVCDNGKIYDPETACIWDVDNDNKWQNRADSNKKLRLHIQTTMASYIIGTKLVAFETLVNSSYSTPTISISNNIATIEIIQYYGLLTFLKTANPTLFFTSSTIYFGSPAQAAFVLKDDGNSEQKWNGSGIDNQGTVYLYKEATEHRYKCQCATYSVQLKACGDNTCSLTSVSPTSLSETTGQATCTKLTTFGGVDLTKADLTINCESTWDSVGWAKEPCPHLTYADPSSSFVGASYIPIHQNETLYAVYKHKVGNYWSSYPECSPHTAFFYPHNGTIVDHPTDDPYEITETTAGAGFIVPAAQTACTSDWTFAGWASDTIVHAGSAPTLEPLTAGERYYPVADNLEYHAVYYRSSIPRWTSFPLCGATTVTLDAVVGTIVSTGESYKILTESGIGTGVTLEPAEVSECSGTWSFAGWSRNQVVSTSTKPDMFVSGKFYPIQENERLYAVYVRGEAPYQTWSSTPTCTRYSVTFYACGTDGCGATVDDVASVTKTEASVGSGVTIPTDVAAACTGRWTFAGWVHGTPIDHTYTDPSAMMYRTTTYKPSQDNEVFYAVYKHADRNYWTSNPDCSDYKIYLHACEGILEHTGNNLDSLTAVAGLGVSLPAPDPLCDDRGWTFKGWIAGGELSTTQNITGLTIYPAGTTYKPIRDKIHLYAVYQISAFQQVTRTDDLVAGEEYVVALYWDYGTAYSRANFAVSNEAHSTYSYALNLKPIDEFFDENGNKIVTEPGDQCKWILGGNSSTGWTFQNVYDSKYIHSADDTRNLETSATATYYNIDLANNVVERKTYTTDFRYWHFLNEGVNTLPNPTFYAFQGKTPDRCYLYRSIDEVYSSWPHCAVYTVKFDGCDGTAEVAERTEVEAGMGVILPSVTDYCSDPTQGSWQFAGWATSPYSTSTDDLDQNIYPAGTRYVPTKNNATLYAIYYKPKSDNKYNRIDNLSQVFTGVNYLIVYNDAYALGETEYNSGGARGINSIPVSSSTGVITNTNNNAINWELRGYENNYIWYNPSVDRYLDLSHESAGTPYASLQTEANTNDNFTMATTTSAGITYFKIRSNSNSYYFRNHASSPYYFEANSNEPIRITLYYQDADFCSYPCSTPKEPMRWGENHFIVESLSLPSTGPTAASSRITGITPGENGTFVVSFDSEVSRKMRIKWGGNYYRFTVPFIASERSTPAVERQPQQHLVILPNASFSVTKDTWLNRLSIYENGELFIENGNTLYVDTLYLRSKGGESHPKIIFGTTASSINISSGIIFHDIRIDDTEYFPFSVPYDVNPSDIRFAGLLPNAVNPTRGVNDVDAADYWIQYYDGETRAEDCYESYETYWRVLDGEGTITGGTGYSIGIADAANAHKERTVRFKMQLTPGAEWSAEQNQSTTRAVAIKPKRSAQLEHSGWNFIGNPYVRRYMPGNADAESGLLTGMWEKDEEGQWHRKSGTETVPYFTFYDASVHDYFQMAAYASLIEPFSAVFIQADDEDKRMLMYTDPIQTSAAPWRRARYEQERIVRTGLLLVPSNEEEQDLYGRGLYAETGFVISDRYTNNYEVGADLIKMYNAYAMNLHLYSINGKYQLAFNALDEQAAANLIPLGVRIPKAGSYTFRFDDRIYNREALDALWLTDYEHPESPINLLVTDYTCTIESGANEQRFALNAVLKAKEDPSTDIEAATPDGLRILSNRNGSVTICSNNVITGLIVYDVAGRLLGEWKPNTYQWTVNLPQGVYAVSVQDAQNQITHVKICSK